MDNRTNVDPGRKVQRERRAYQTPRLMTYGAVRELTAGGSGTKNEGKKDTDPKRRP